MDEIHVHKTKKSICAHFAESPCINHIYYKTYYKPPTAGMANLFHRTGQQLTVSSKLPNLISTKVYSEN